LLTISQQRRQTPFLIEEWRLLIFTSCKESVRRLLVTSSVVPVSPIFVTLMKEALRSSETSVLIRATGRDIPEGAILHSHRRGNLKSYIALTGSAL
jgi:hypothetical protein